MRYYVYIIYSKLTKKSYTGITSNIDRRLTEHNRNHGSAKWTQTTSDFDLVFCTEINDRLSARLIEIYLKSGIGREFKKTLILKYLDL